MNIARTGRTAPFMVMEVEIFVRGMPSNSSWKIAGDFQLCIKEFTLTDT
jgi:hypothetical protein